MTFNEQILSNLTPTYNDEIAQDYETLIEETGEYIVNYRRVVTKDAMNRDSVSYVFGDTIKGIVVLKNVVMQYGGSGLIDTQQSYLWSDAELNLRDRIEYSGVLYEIQRSLVMGNIYMYTIKEVETNG